MNVSPCLDDEHVAVRLRVGVAVAGQHDLGAHGSHRIHFDPRRRLRHDDDRAEPELARREGDALRMIAGARRDDAAGALVGRQVRDLVVGAAKLEAEDRLQVLALEEHRVAEPARQAWRRIERRLTRDVVDAAGEDVVEKRGERRIQRAKSISFVRIVRGALASGRGSSVLATRSAIKRVAVNIESGRATTCTRPAAMAAQIASAFGSASTSEYVVPSCSRRCTSPLPTIGLRCRCAHRSAKALKFTYGVNIAFHSTASNSPACFVRQPRSALPAGKNGCGAMTRPRSCCFRRARSANESTDSDARL